MSRAIGEVFAFGVGDGVDASENGGPADWVGIVKFVIAVLLLLVAARQWRGRPSDHDEPEGPGIP